MSAPRPGLSLPWPAGMCSFSAPAERRQLGGRTEPRSRGAAQQLTKEPFSSTTQLHHFSATFLFLCRRFHVGFSVPASQHSPPFLSSRPRAAPALCAREPPEQSLPESLQPTLSTTGRTQGTKKMPRFPIRNHPFLKADTKKNQPKEHRSPPTQLLYHGDLEKRHVWL